MGDKSKIEWTEATWNPIVGCSVTSPGCANCYAMPMAARLEAMGLAHYKGTTQSSKAGPVWTGKVALAPETTLLAPLRRKKPTTYFVNSMSDLFHEAVPDDWIDRIFAVMALCPQHTFQVLTKRSRRMRDYMTGENPLIRLHYAAAGDSSIAALFRKHGNIYSLYLDAPWPLPNCWLGVSAEDQTRADERIPDLLATPAAVRFISAEPLLGPIDIGKWLPSCHECAIECGWRAAELEYPDEEKCNHCGMIWKSADIEEFCPSCGNQDFSGVCPSCGGNVVQSHPDTPCLDWVIVGGESSPGARPMHPDWARSLRDQCAAAGVAYFHKQNGEWLHKPEIIDAGGPSFHRFSDGTFAQRVGKRAAGRLLDGREHNDMPAPAAAPQPELLP